MPLWKWSKVQILLSRETMKRYAVLILFMLAAPAFGQTPAPPVPAVTLPVLPAPPSPAPQPAPKPAPGTPVVLASDVLYVASSKAECLLLISTTDAGKQAGEIVRTTCLKGPVTFALTKLIDGGGKRETRTFADPFIWTLEAVGSGTVEVIFVPKAGGNVVRQLITTNTAPQPPPTPIDPPVPADPLTALLQAALAKEAPTDKLLLPKLAALYRQSAQLSKDTTITTADALHATMKTARLTLVGDALPNVRAVVTAELDKVLPTTVGAALDAPTRAACAAAFTRIAAALEGIK
jgi:hypothetical protein